MSSTCRWCGLMHGPFCPAVKSIEYAADGVTVHKVEFKTASDYAPSVFWGGQPAAQPSKTTTCWTR